MHATQGALLLIVRDVGFDEVFSAAKRGKLALGPGARKEAANVLERFEFDDVRALESGFGYDHTLICARKFLMNESRLNIVARSRAASDICVRSLSSAKSV